MNSIAKNSKNNSKKLTPINAFKDYLFKGYKLTTWNKSRGKSPTKKGWGVKPASTVKTNDNIGLIHGLSRTFCLDIDDLERAEIVLTHFGISITSLKENYPCYFGSNKSRPKILMRLPEDISSNLVVEKLPYPREHKENGEIFSLRGATPDKDGKMKAVQDVLPPSIHPDTKKPYQWFEGKEEVPHIDDLPVMPKELVALWENWNDLLPEIKHLLGWEEEVKKESGIIIDNNEQGTNVIQIFNDTYNISDLLNKNGYTQKGDRWISPKSESGTAGVVILTGNDGKEYVYSHHGSDPLDSDKSKSLDAFGLYTHLVHNDDLKSALKGARELLGIDGFDEAGDNLKQCDQELINYKYYREFRSNHYMIVSGAHVHFLEKFLDDDGNYTYSYGVQQSKKLEWGDRTMTYRWRGKDGWESKAIDVLSIAIHGLPSMGIPAMKRWKGITFKPNKDTEVKFNLFDGFPIIPIKGSIEPFKTFLTSAVGDAEVTDHILDWFAHMYQRPEEKILWAIATRGGKGTGKNLTMQMLGEWLLNPENYFSTAIPDKLFGKFLGHMSSNLLAVADEMVWGGDHDIDSVIKDFITNPRRAIEAKYKDATMLDNYSRLYLTSNAEWVVPASGKEERRYFVADFSESGTNFGALIDWYDNKGGREALMYEMLNRDISNLSIHKAPYSLGLQRQLEKSLNGIERYIYETLCNGAFGVGSREIYSSASRPQITKKNTVGASDVYEHYKSIHQKEKLTQTSFGKTCKDLLGVVSDKRVGSARHWQLPSIKRAREAFTQRTGIDFMNEEIDKWHHGADFDCIE